MKKTLAMVATATLLGSAAFAPYSIAQEVQPANPTVQAPGQTTTMPMSPQATVPGAPAMDMAVSSAAFLTEQGPDQVSANEYIGRSIYTAAEENIGSVRDILIEKDRGVVAAIVGVGGFLGMGEKSVALPVASISIIRTPDNGDIRLTTTETAESLKAAPEFVTTADKQAAAASEALRPDSTTTSSTRP